MAHYSASDAPIGGELDDTILRRQCRQGTEKLRAAMLAAGYLTKEECLPPVLEKNITVQKMAEKVIIQLQKKIVELESQLNRDKTRKTICADVAQAICEYYSLSKSELFSRRRALSITRPRQVCMYLCKELTNNSLPEIGRRIGDLDHTTVLHAVRRIGRLIETDPEIANDVAILRSRIVGE